MHKHHHGPVDVTPPLQKLLCHPDPAKLAGAHEARHPILEIQIRTLRQCIREDIGTLIQCRSRSNYLLALYYLLIIILLSKSHFTIF